MHDYLSKIIEKTHESLQRLKQQFADFTVHEREIKSLKKALSHSTIDIIAEIKRHSPSLGKLASITNPLELVNTYVSAKASAISVLTNEYGFSGSINDLQQIATALNDTEVAVLRKDFIIDPIQIIESVQCGADALLLIVAVTQEKTESLLKFCRTCGIEALVEVHNKNELDYALSIGAEIIGVNNRNLTTFEIDTTIALNLKPYIPNHIISVAESGIKNAEIAKQYIEAGFNALLIGEALVTAADPKKFIQEIYANSY